MANPFPSLRTLGHSERVTETWGFQLYLREGSGYGYGSGHVLCAAAFYFCRLEFELHVYKFS